MENQPLLSQGDQSGIIRNQFEQREERENERYTSLLAAIVVLGLLIIIGLIVGFIIVGIQGKNTYDKTKDIDNEVEDIWSSNKEILTQLAKIEANTEQILKDIADLEDNVGNISMAIEQIVVDALDEFFPQKLPAAVYICGPQGSLTLPASENVLISGNLSKMSDFPETSFTYHPRNGRIEITKPNLESTETVSVSVLIRVFIDQAGGESGDTAGTFSLILSTSPNCKFEDCPDGFYSTLSRFDPNDPEFNENGLWMELNPQFTIKTGLNFYVFLRSNNGNGFVRHTESGDVTPCAGLTISIQSMTDTFLIP